MELGSRSRSLRALSQAQPIKKDIDQTLAKLQVEKRRYLALERQQNNLIQVLSTKKKDLNMLKKVQPVTQYNSKKAQQNFLDTKNVDRAYEIRLSRIQELKKVIDVGRRQITKYKKLNKGIKQEIDVLNEEVETILDNIQIKEEENQNIKREIIHYREQNIQNLSEFRQSHSNLRKSDLKEEKQRKKYSVTTHTFLGEEMRNSKTFHLDNWSAPIRESGLFMNEGKIEMMTESVPLAKLRVNALIHHNKEKIKIAQEYMKFGGGLEEMFRIMKEYKGQDDVNFLAQQFVAKERQIQKLGEYIGKLEDRILSLNSELNDRIEKDEEIKEGLMVDNFTQSERQYQELNKHVEQEINELRQEQKRMNSWLKRVGETLCPLISDDDFSRGNVSNVMGKIEERIGIDKSDGVKGKASPSRHTALPAIDSDEFPQKYSELLSYESMKQYANKFIKTKRS